MTVGQIKPSMAILYNGELFSVLSCEHAKLGRGGAFCRVKLKNFKSSQVLNCTLRDSDDIDEAFIEGRKLNFLYRDGDFFHFMDMETYEDFILNETSIKNSTCWLTENFTVSGLFYKGELVSLEMPLSLELTVTETDPGFRGDTVKQGTKLAKMETGLSIQVPLFISVGDVVKIDTRTKEYLGRAK